MRLLAAGRNRVGTTRVSTGMDLFEAVRSAVPPDPTPWMIVATLIVILTLGREAEPQRRRRS